MTDELPDPNVGGHHYPGCVDPHPDNFFTSDCVYGCGAWMGRARSGAPEGIDPGGDCPNTPEGKKKGPPTPLEYIVLRFPIKEEPLSERAAAIEDAAKLVEAGLPGPTETGWAAQARREILEAAAVRVRALKPRE